MWKDIKHAPKRFVDDKPLIFVGIDKEGNVSKTCWHHIAKEWMMLTGEGMVIWNPIKWVPLP